MVNNLKIVLGDATKDAMRAKEKTRLGVLRLIAAAIKQQEVDRRVVLSDVDIIKILVQMIKQRKEAALQFSQCAREDLAQKEHAEIAIIASFLPEQLPIAKVAEVVEQTISDSQASSIKDMPMVMQQLATSLLGIADLGVVAKLVKDRLTGQAKSPN